MREDQTDTTGLGFKPRTKEREAYVAKRRAEYDAAEHEGREPSPPNLKKRPERKDG